MSSAVQVLGSRYIVSWLLGWDCSLFLAPTYGNQECTLAVWNSTSRREQTTRQMKGRDHRRTPSLPPIQRSSDAASTQHLNTIQLGTQDVQCDNYYKIRICRWWVCIPSTWYLKDLLWIIKLSLFMIYDKILYDLLIEYETFICVYVLIL